MIQTNFNVKEKRGFVSYSQMVGNTRCVGIARLGDGDTFNTEYGKALAYARFDYESRKTSINALKELIKRIESEFMYGGKDKYVTERHFRDHYLGVMYSDLKMLLGYQTNQKKIIKVLEGITSLYATQNGFKEAHDYLQYAHDQVVKK